ncbi:MAG: FGGY-family carbohydrate kinase, partial [Cyclobacteriaceae bacterium]|nr:FGGY-family carbohydrate kinase [Cyclobacteriaceae bacterium]
HFYRAALEGIAYSFIYGIDIMKSLGLNTNVMRVGNDNLFQSEVFSTTIATVLDCEIEMIETTGAIGAAKAAGLAANIYSSPEEAFRDTQVIKTYQSIGKHSQHKNGYETWKSDLEKILG